MEGFFFRMFDYFDLFGDPIPENWRKRGQPSNLQTVRKRNNIKLLLAFIWANPRIAQALRTAGKVLSKYFFCGLRQRDEARPAPDCLGRTTFEKAGHCGAAPW